VFGFFQAFDPDTDTDLEWMKRAGIAGVQNSDAGLNTPQIVERRLVYMTPPGRLHRRLLLISQRDQGIDPRRPPRRDDAGCHGDEEQQQGYAHKCEWVVRTHPEKHAGHQPCQRD